LLPETEVPEEIAVSAQGSPNESMRQEIPIGLSTASVYPQNTEAAFQYANDLGYDGIELMVWAEPVSQDIDRVAFLSDRYHLPVLSVHAPCLLISQRVWGRDPAAKLARSVAAAETLGAGTVVLHPPFRWQRRYAGGFRDLIDALEQDSGVDIAVENMFPVRTDRFFGKYEEAAGRMRRRGGGPGAAVSAFATSIDPTDDGFAHYTLDLSHAATAGTDAIEMLDRMGSGLRHLHLTDGSGAAVDEHLVPGDGSQPCVQVCNRLAAGEFSGSAILEVSTSSVSTKAERREILSRSLDFARTHLERP
jgi:sugar phosphate isomerase/epimerase